MKKYFAELIGTFALVLFGCGTATIAGASGAGLVGIALAFGLTVVVMAYAIGPISGCHINPAITISMLVAGKIKIGDVVGYIVAQVAGAIIAAAVLNFILNGSPDYVAGEWALGANGWGEGYLGEYNTGAAFLAEALFTFIFLFVIFAVTSENANSTMAGLAIGVTLVLIHLTAIKVTGVSVNPARSIGPAIFAGGKALSQLWLFLIAPVVGGIIAAIVWKGMFAKE